MDFNSKDMGPDALDELLRKLLLEQNPEGPDGQSLLEQAAGTVFGEAPLVLPDPHRELQMITRLQEEFGTAAQPAPVPAEPVPSDRRRIGFWLPFGAVAAAAAVALLWAFWPAGTTTPADPSAVGIASTETPPPAGGSTVMPAAGHSTPGDAQPTLIMPHTGANPFPSVNPGSSPANTRPEASPRNPEPRTAPGAQPATQPLYTSPQPILAGNPLTQPVNHAALNPMAMASMDMLRARIEPTGTVHTFDPKRDYFLHTDQGTIVHIPAMCFRDAEGKPVETPVTLRLKEIYKRSEFLRADVLTETYGQPMAAAAALEFTAYSGNKELKVRDGKEIYVEFGKLSASATSGMDMVGSAFAQRAENLHPVQGRQSRMVTIPSDQLHFDEFWCDCRADAQWNQVLYDLTQPQYQNSWVSTLEFRRRLEAMAAMDYQSEALSIYRDNIGKDLWRVDQMVEKKYRENGRMRTPDNKSYMDEVFQRFSLEMLTQPEAYQPGNRNFDLPNFYQQLLAQNLSEQEADRLTRVHRLRNFYAEEVGKAYTKAIENEKNKRNPTLKMGSMASQLKDRPGFFIRQTGWTTLAKALNAGNGAELRVEISGAPANAAVRTWVVYGEMISVLGARMTGQQSARLHDAPLSPKAWVVSVAWDGNLPWLAIQRLSMDGERNELLVLQPTTPEALVQAFQALDRF